MKKISTKLAIILASVAAVCLGVGVGFATWILPGATSGDGSVTNSISADPDYVATSFVSHSITSFCQSGFIVPDTADASFTGYKLTNSGQLNVVLRHSIVPQSSQRSLTVNLSIQSGSSSYLFSSSDITKTYTYGSSFNGTAPSPSSSLSGTPTTAGLFTISVSVPASTTEVLFAFRIALTCAQDKFNDAIYKVLVPSATAAGYRLSASAEWGTN